MKVAIVGVGGIGSHLMDDINQLCAAGQFKNWHFHIYDDDVVEPKNLDYQRFKDEDMGLLKVTAVEQACLDILLFSSYNKRVNPEELKKMDIVVSCVDSGAWRRKFFDILGTSTSLKFWIDLRSEGRTVAAYTKHKTNTKEKLINTVQGADEENGSCQLDYELNKGIIQTGNRIIASIGVQYLLNFYHGETCAPEFLHRF